LQLCQNGFCQGAGAGTKAASASVGTFSGGDFYRLTKQGLEAGVTASGIKVWKDKDLN
jgi:hypothetical protein